MAALFAVGVMNLALAVNHKLTTVIKGFDEILSIPKIESCLPRNVRCYGRYSAELHISIICKEAQRALAE
jgi:hypothetical protein